MNRGNDMEDAVNENIKSNLIKQEVVSAYNEVLRKLKETTSALDVDPHQEQIAHEKQQIVETILHETPDELVKNMNDLKHLIGKTLDDIKQRLLPEYEKFFTVRKAIAFSEAELKELYHIKVSAGSLTALVQAQKEKMLAHENEITASRKAFVQEKLKMAKDLEKEEADYIIKRDAARKLDNEKYENSKREVEKALAEKRAAFEEEFESREARIAAREKDHQQLKEREAWILARDQEYHQLKERATYHAEELRLAVQKVERAAVDKLTSKYEYEAKLMHIEIESDRKMYQQKIATLEEQIAQYKSLKQLFGNQPAISEESTSTEEAVSIDQSLLGDHLLYAEQSLLRDQPIVNETPSTTAHSSINDEKELNDKILRDFLLADLPTEGAADIYGEKFNTPA